MSELEEIKVFVNLVESQTAAQAAEKMGLANSAISRRLKSLESRLGAQLLQRTTRTMHLTEDGRRFYLRCKQLLDDWQEAQLEVSRSATQLTGEIRISTPLSFGVAHLAPAIAAFMHLHSDITIDLDMTDRRVDLVEEGFDLAIRIGELTDSTLIARKLAKIKHVVCCSESFLQQHGPFDQPELLKQVPSLCYSNLKTPDRWRYRDTTGTEHTIKVNPRMQSSNGDALKEAAISGLGVVCQPTFIVHQAIEQKLLVPILTDYQWYDMSMYAIYPNTRHLPRRVRALLDFLYQRFGQNPYWDSCM